MESSPIHPWWTSKEGWWQGPCHLRRGSVKSCQATCFFWWSKSMKFNIGHFWDIVCDKDVSSFIQFLNKVTCQMTQTWELLSHRTLCHGGVSMIAVVHGNFPMVWCSSWRMQDSGGVLKNVEVSHRFLSDLVLLDPSLWCWWTCCCIDTSRCRRLWFIHADQNPTWSVIM